MNNPTGGKLKITLLRSPYGRIRRHRETLRVLGLHKQRQTVIKDDNPAIRGMVNAVSYLVECEQLEG